MKPFDLEKAKNGAEVCLGDGTPVKIMDFDFNDLLMVKIPYMGRDGREISILCLYHKNGDTADMDEPKEKRRLFLRPKTGYMKVYRNNSTGLLEGDTIYADFTSVKYDAGSPIGKDFFCFAKVELLEPEGGEE